MKSISLWLLLGCLTWSLGRDCVAQSSGRDRVKEIRAVYIWQRTALDEQQLRRLLADLGSSNPAKVREAIDAIALAKPIPAAAEVVVKTLHDVESRAREQTARLVVIEACRDWEEAKHAWELMQEARRRGGFRALEQAATQERSARKGDAMIAIAYSEDERAPQVLAEH